MLYNQTKLWVLTVSLHFSLQTKSMPNSMLDWRAAHSNSSHNTQASILAIHSLRAMVTLCCEFQLLMLLPSMFMGDIFHVSRKVGQRELVDVCCIVIALALFALGRKIKAFAQYHVGHFYYFWHMPHILSNHTFFGTYFRKFVCETALPQIVGLLTFC